MRNKLRFQSIHRTICLQKEFGLAPSFRLAVIVTGGRRLDDVLYSYLGRAGVKKRATMGDMLNPKTSVVLSSQQAYLRLLRGFNRATPEWNLLKSIGADFKDEALRHFSRHQLIGYFVGIFYVF